VGLHLPQSIEKLCHTHQVLIILAGVTGSGKSTTIAPCSDYINERETGHILTIEARLNTCSRTKGSSISAPVYIESRNWHNCVEHAVREDPDVILVGEMRRPRTRFEAGIHSGGEPPLGCSARSTPPAPVDAQP